MGDTVSEVPSHLMFPTLSFRPAIPATSVPVPVSATQVSRDYSAVPPPASLQASFLPQPHAEVPIRRIGFLSRGPRLRDLASPRFVNPPESRDSPIPPGPSPSFDGLEEDPFEHMRDDPFELSSTGVATGAEAEKTQESEPPSAVMSQARSSMSQASSSMSQARDPAMLQARSSVSQADKVQDLLRAARE